MPTPVTRQAVADAFKAALLTITTANGYSRTLPVDHFYKNFDAEKLKVTDAVTYPKVFVTAGDEDPKQEVSRRKNVTEKYFVTLVVLQSKKGTGCVDVEPSEQLNAMLDDLEKCLQANMTLGGTVNEVTLDGVSKDSGFAYPEGIAIVEISLQYYKQY